MSTNVTTREYRAGVIIYAEDARYLYDVQHEIWKVVHGSNDYEALETVVNTAKIVGNLAGVFKFSTAETVANIYEAIFSTAHDMSEAERQQLKDYIILGYDTIECINDYFVNRPHVDAIETTLGFIEVGNNPGWRVIAFDSGIESHNDIECSRLLVNGTWLEP